MSATQVSSEEEEEEHGLKASTSSATQLRNRQQPQHSTKNNQVSIPPRPSPPPPFCFTPVSRVITKESLREFETSTTRFDFLPAAQRQVDVNFGGVGIDDDDEHSLQSSLFEFSLLDPDGRDGELLALPLPLTSSSSPSIDVVDAEHFLAGPPTLHNLDTYAALLSFDSSSIFHEDSDSTTASSSLAAVSTAAAIVASQQQQQQLLQLSVNEVGDKGSVPSLVAVYPDCTTHQPSAPIIHNNSVKPKSKRTTARGGGAAKRKANSVISRSNSTTTTRGTKIAFVNNQVTHEQTLQGYIPIMEQEPDSTVLPPPLPETTVSTQASMTRYAPQPTVASSQGSDVVVDPTTTSTTLQYHQANHNHSPSVPPLGSLNHHRPAVSNPPQGGTVITRPRLSNMHHHQPARVGGVNGGNVPSPRSTSSSPSENNQPHRHQGPSLSKSMVANNNNLHPTTTAAAAAFAAAENTGRWTAEEHRLFLQGLEQHGKGWKKIATLIQSRTVVQIRTHAQKYFQKLTKAHQAGEGGVPLGGGGGGISGTVGGGFGTQMISAGTAEGDGTVGIAIPLGPDGQPVVSMRTTSHATASASSSSGNNGTGSDPSSTWAGTGGEGGAAAGAMHGSGRSRQRASHASGGGTKRRVIGNVVRSAVREGRNVKRQKIAELKRKVAGGGGDDTPVLDVAPSSDPASGGGKEDHHVVPNPIPSVSKILEPYMPPPPPPRAPSAAPGHVCGRGRQQLVHTATHGTLPMAALEDAVFRLLTPATGAPPPPRSQQQQQQSHPKNNAAVIDPLARQSNANHQANVPLTHSKYPPLSGGGPSGYPQGILNYSPTGIADMALLPSWVDAKNPPSWYNDGSDIDTLLEDADCLNWLSDTGDLDETYPPAMAEPAAVVSSSSTAANSIGAQTIAIASTTIQEPAGGVFHPSTDSLSFLVDPPEHPHDVEDVNQLPSFLDEPLPPLAGAADATYASATEAVEATTSAPITSSSFASTTIHIPKHQLDSVGDSVNNLVGFPDLDMGDEQAFVSAMLENSAEHHELS